MAKAMLIAIVDLARLLVKTEAQVKQIFIFTEPTTSKDCVLLKLSSKLSS
jgi:hypothetical protein